MGVRVRRILSAVAVLSLVGAAAAAHGGSDRSGLSTIGNRGHGAVAVDRTMKSELAAAGVDTPITVMAVRDHKEFVRFATEDKGMCFGVKKPEAARFGFTCWNDFPSPAHPILDESVFGSDNGEPIHVIEVEGFAANGVVAIDLVDPAGVTLGRVPTAGNVYSLAAVPPSTVRLVAVNPAGRAVAAVPR